VVGPLELERDPVRDRAQAVEPLVVARGARRAHVLELAHGPRRQAVAARLLAWEALLLDDEDPVPASASQYAAAAPDGPPPTRAVDAHADRHAHADGRRSRGSSTPTPLI
jgi:hypothetical protein